jgi:hypothetical protein
VALPGGQHLGELFETWTWHNGVHHRRWTLDGSTGVLGHLLEHVKRKIHARHAQEWLAIESKRALLDRLAV